MYGLLGYLKIWNLRVQKNRNIEKFAFKGVQMNSFAIYITSVGSNALQVTRVM